MQRTAAKFLLQRQVRAVSCHDSLCTVAGVDQTEIQNWLDQLRVEHRDLDVVIAHMVEARHHDTMRIQRLKQRKLKLKDMISKLESELIPDLDA